MSFLSSLFGGSNPTLNSQIPALGEVARNSTATGTSDVGSASTFWQNILGGNAAKAVAPQINSIQKQGQQKLQTLSQFSNRSGGTNAEAATTADSVSSSINDLIASLTNSAATNLGSLGSNLLNTGLSAYGQQKDAAQMQMDNWKNSIFGSAITGAVNYGESFLPVPHGGK